MRLLELLNERYHELLCERYKMTDEETADIDAYDLLELVAQKRGMLQSGGTVNTERAAIAVLDEFRSGKIGKITLETPQKPQKKERLQPSFQEEC